SKCGTPGLRPGLTHSQPCGWIRTKRERIMPQDGYLDYVELPGSDIPATKAFYGSVFGWSFTDYGPDYVAFDSGGRQGGFNGERRVVEKGGPLIVLYAADLDGMEAKVRAAGAEVISR